jgi:hypothetical protein
VIWILRANTPELPAARPSFFSVSVPQPRFAHASGATRARCGKRANFWLRFYGWFTEGFDTRDLKEVKALLEELAA